MSTISQWAVYQMCETLDNNYTYILKIVKDVYPELYSKSPDYDWQRKSILGYFHKSFAKFLRLKDDKKIEKEKWKPFKWSKWNKTTDKETVIDLTPQVPTNWDVYDMYQLTNGDCSQVFDQLRNEYPNFVIPANYSEDNLKDEIFVNYEKIQSILDNGGEKELNEEKETPFSWQLIELGVGIHRPYSIQWVVPNVEKSIDAVQVEDDNNGQQISRKNSKDQSKSSHSYHELIVEAISSTPDKQLTLNGIYNYITQHYPQKYKAINISWKKLVKRKLYSSDQFVKIHNSRRRTAKGCLWRIASISESKRASRTLKRTSQEPIPCSTTPNDGYSISAANFDPNSPRDGSSYSPVPDHGKTVYAAHVDNNGQQISTKSSKNNSKPPYTYVQLISQAISSVADKQLTLRKIYSYIKENYPHWKNISQNSLRHNLSFYPYFVKVPNSEKKPRTGSFWKIDPAWESNLIAEAFKQRRPSSLRTPEGELSTTAAKSCPKSPDSNQCLMPDVRESVDAADAAGDNNGQQISRKHSKNQYKSSHYHELIVEAISSTLDKQLTLNNIYNYITQRCPQQYKAINVAWKKLVKRKLYSSDQFEKVHNYQNRNSNHCLWRIASVSESNSTSRTLQKSRQKAAPCSTTPSEACSIRSESSCLNGQGSSRCVVPDLGKTVDAAHVEGDNVEKSIDAVQVRGDNNGQQISRKHSKDQSKSSHSYHDLIVEAISSTPDKQLTLNDIYNYIAQHYPQKYKAINISWKKLVKRKLYSSGQFVKLQNSESRHGKACLWGIASVSESNPASRTLKGSCENTVPCSTTPNDEFSIKSFPEPNTNEMQDSLKDDVAVCENLTDPVSFDNCLSTSPPPPPASLHLNPNILPVSQVQTPPSTGTPPPPLRPSTEVSRVPLEETPTSTSPPSPIDMLAGGSDDSECQNLILSIREFENLISNGMREIGETDAKIERLKAEIYTVSINQIKMRRNLKRLRDKHQQKKMNLD